MLEMCTLVKYGSLLPTGMWVVHLEAVAVELSLWNIKALCTTSKEKIHFFKKHNTFNLEFYLHWVFGSSCKCFLPHFSNLFILDYNINVWKGHATFVLRKCCCSLHQHFPKDRSKQSVQARFKFLQLTGFPVFMHHLTVRSYLSCIYSSEYNT